MHIKDWPIGRVAPYPNNPRILRNAAEKVAESIREFGWRQPIVVDDDGVVIIGHTRLAAAKLLKLETVPVHVASGLSPEKVRALRIADNKTAEFAAWDDPKLADELSEIMASLGNVTVAGFSQSEFDAIEMQARAALKGIPGLEAAVPVEQDEDEGDFDLPDDEQKSDDTGTGGDDAPAAGRDMVPFSVLMDVDARQVVYDAIAKAKQKHGLELTADALLVICRGYVDA